MIYMLVLLKFVSPSSLSKIKPIHSSYQLGSSAWISHGHFSGHMDKTALTASTLSALLIHISFPYGLCLSKGTTTYTNSTVLTPLTSPSAHPHSNFSGLGSSLLLITCSSLVTGLSVSDLAHSKLFYAL